MMKQNNRIEEYKYWEDQYDEKFIKGEEGNLELKKFLEARENLTIEDMKVLMEEAVSPRVKVEWQKRIREKEEPKAMEIMGVK